MRPARLSPRLLPAIFPVALLFAMTSAAQAQAPAAEPVFQPRLLIAFSAYHPRPKYPTIYFYEHDGAAQGKIVGSVDVTGKRSDYHASLSLDGRYCAFASEEENNVSKILLWDRTEGKLVDLPGINETPHAQLYASLSGTAKILAYTSWRHPQAQGRWDVLLYDVAAKQRLLLTALNTVANDERTPALSADGRVIGFTTNARSGKGLTDIHLYELESGLMSPAAEMNSPQRDIEPSLSGDGDLVAFCSDRPGGEGGLDIYLYQRSKHEFLPLPNLNYVSHDQAPKLSADGRYLVFTSERLAGEGERDVFLYDRVAGKLLPTPGLNGKYEDLDPCVIVLP